MLSLSVAFWSCGGSDGDDDDDNGGGKEPVEFVWNGDWNDPSDPNYKKDGYNPVKGVWRYGNSTSGIKYTEKFEIYSLTFYSYNEYEERYIGKYIINDKAYRYGEANITDRYTIKADMMTVYFSLNIDDVNRDRIYYRIE